MGKDILKAVLFDMDGTLTDTEKYYRKAWPEAMAHFGYKMEDWMSVEILSLGYPFVLDKFREWFGEDLNFYEVREYRRGLVEELVREGGIPLKPGAKEILTWMREKGILTVLVTGNEYPKTERYLKKADLFGYFDKIICSNMVKVGKPAPDIYAYACKELGLDPSETFAVEDSPNGVISAYEAGCRVIMVPDMDQPDEEVSKKLYRKVDKLLDIKSLIE